MSEQLPQQFESLPKLPKKETPTLEQDAVLIPPAKSEKDTEDFDVIRIPTERPSTIEGGLYLPEKDHDESDIAFIQNLVRNRLVESKQRVLGKKGEEKVTQLTKDVLDGAIAIKKELLEEARAKSHDGVNERLINREVSEFIPDLIYLHQKISPVELGVKDEKEKGYFDGAIYHVMQEYKGYRNLRERVRMAHVVAILQSFAKHKKILADTHFTEAIIMLDDLLESATEIVRDENMPHDLTMTTLVVNIVAAIQLVESGIRSSGKYDREHVEERIIETALSLATFGSEDKERVQKLAQEMQDRMPSFVPELGSKLYIDKEWNIGKQKTKQFRDAWVVAGYDEGRQAIIVHEDRENPQYGFVRVQKLAYGNDVEYTLSDTVEPKALDVPFFTPYGELKSEARSDTAHALEKEQSSAFTKSIARVRDWNEFRNLISRTPFEGEYPDVNSWIMFKDPAIASRTQTKVFSKREVLMMLDDKDVHINSLPIEYGFRAKIRALRERDRMLEESREKILSTLHAEIRRADTFEKLSVLIREAYAHNMKILSQDGVYYQNAERPIQRIRQYITGEDTHMPLSSKDMFYHKVVQLHDLAQVREKLAQ